MILQLDLRLKSVRAPTTLERTSLRPFAYWDVSCANILPIELSSALRTLFGAQFDVTGQKGFRCKLLMALLTFQKLN